jgi:hypothetical protein
MRQIVFPLALFLISTTVFAETLTFTPAYTKISDSLNGEAATSAMGASVTWPLFSVELKSNLALAYSETNYTNFHKLESFEVQDNFISADTLNGNKKSISGDYKQDCARNFRLFAGTTKNTSTLLSSSNSYRAGFELDAFDQSHLITVQASYYQYHSDAHSSAINYQTGLVTVPPDLKSWLYTLKDSIALMRLWTMDLEGNYRKKDDRPNAYDAAMAHSFAIPPLSGYLHLSGRYFKEKEQLPLYATYGALTGHSLAAVWIQNFNETFFTELGYKYYYEREALITRPKFGIFGSDTFHFKMELEMTETNNGFAREFKFNRFSLGLTFQYYQTNRKLSGQAWMLNSTIGF